MNGYDRIVSRYDTAGSPDIDGPLADSETEAAIWQTMVAAHPDDTDEQISERIRRAFRSMGSADGEVPMTAEVVARWRPEVAQ